MQIGPGRQQHTVHNTLTAGLFFSAGRSPGGTEEADRVAPSGISSTTVQLDELSPL